MASLLEGIGNALSLPGSMVRDIATLNNPLDQLLTPFSGDNRTTPQDLLHKMGVEGDSPWLSFGVDMATDPLNLFGIGAGVNLARGIKGAGLVGKAKGGLQSLGKALSSPDEFAKAKAAWWPKKAAVAAADDAAKAAVQAEPALASAVGGQADDLAAVYRNATELPVQQTGYGITQPVTKSIDMGAMAKQAYQPPARVPLANEGSLAKYVNTTGVHPSTLQRAVEETVPEVGLFGAFSPNKPTGFASFLENVPAAAGELPSSSYGGFSSFMPPVQSVAQAATAVAPEAATGFKAALQRAFFDPNYRNMAKGFAKQGAMNEGYAQDAYNRAVEAANLDYNLPLGKRLGDPGYVRAVAPMQGTY